MKVKRNVIIGIVFYDQRDFRAFDQDGNDVKSANAKIEIIVEN